MFNGRTSERTNSKANEMMDQLNRVVTVLYLSRAGVLRVHTDKTQMAHSIDL
jgi:hypothetical protein